MYVHACVDVCLTLLDEIFRLFPFYRHWMVCARRFPRWAWLGLVALAALGVMLYASLRSRQHSYSRANARFDQQQDLEAKPASDSSLPSPPLPNNHSSYQTPPLNQHNSKTRDAVAGAVKDMAAVASEDELALDVPVGYYPIAADRFTEDYDTKITLCSIPFTDISANPSLTPMFRDVVNRYCSVANCIVRRLSSLERMRGMVAPSGFIFHETRVGSTLAAELLATDPDNLVYSESPLLSSGIDQCISCSHQRKVHVLRVLYNAMGNSDTHTRLFLKFPPVIMINLHVLFEAFPHVPWVYMFRESVEVLASYLKKSTRAPQCSYLPPPIETPSLSAPSRTTNIGCCKLFHTLNMYAELELNRTGSHHGIAVHYRSLPADFIEYVIQYHFSQPLKERVKSAMTANGRIDAKVPHTIAKHLTVPIIIMLCRTYCT